jgi:hypothetical protein
MYRMCCEMVKIGAKSEMKGAYQKGPTDTVTRDENNLLFYCLIALNVDIVIAIL